MDYPLSCITLWQTNSLLLKITIEFVDLRYKIVIFQFFTSTNKSEGMKIPTVYLVASQLRKHFTSSHQL